MVTGLPGMGENQDTAVFPITWGSATAAEATSSTSLNFCHQTACYSLSELPPSLPGIQKEKTPKLTDHAINFGQFSCLMQQQNWLTSYPQN